MSYLSIYNIKLNETNFEMSLYIFIFYYLYLIIVYLIDFT